MITTERFSELALSFPDVVELPHLEKTSFRIKKKIFATLSHSTRISCVKLSDMDQSIFSSVDKSIIYPVPNKWGQKGYTFIELDKIDDDTVKDILTLSYDLVRG